MSDHEDEDWYINEYDPPKPKALVHGQRCRTQLASIMPNYGADCTCGAEYMLEYVKEKWAEGPEAVANNLQDKIWWRDKKEGDLV